MDEPVDSVDSLPKSLEADGERFLPDQMHGNIELEHLHRYSFASQFVANKVVLDIASGEGYGSAYLARFAQRVIGVDIAKDAVDYANLKYSRTNLEYRVGTCSAIPLEDHSIDVVVSFETIEHHSEHEAMMQEIKRVLRPGGIFVISSPDKYEYSDKPSFQNPFHVKELYLEEFRALLASHFKNISLYGQRVMLGSVLISQSNPEGMVFQQIGSDSAPVTHMPAPLYWLAVASDEKLPAANSGIFEQPLDELWREISSEKNTKIAELINAVAAPDSHLLKDQLHGSWYLKQNPDLVAANVDAYEHWLTNGMVEGRIPTSDPVHFAQALISEREESLRLAIEAKEQELHQTRLDTLERQRALEAEVTQIQFKARDEVDVQLRILAERERAFGEQLTQLQQAASQERAALAEQHAEREAALLLAIDEKEQALRKAQHDTLERQRALEAEVAQTRLKARDEVDAQLRTLAERERAFGEQLTQLQQAASQERAALAEQHAEREAALLLAIDEKEQALRKAQHDTIERQRALEAEVTQTRIKARDEVDAQLRTLAERERAFGEQLTQLQQAASQERAALAEQHAEREAALLLAIDEKEQALRKAQHDTLERQRVLEAEVAQTRLKARDEVDAQLRTLAERERAFGEQLIQLQQAANQERVAQMEASRQEISALTAQHADRLLNLQSAAIEERNHLKQKHGELLLALNNKLTTIQSTWSWRLTAPVRFLTGRFGVKNDYTPLDYQQIMTLLAPQESEFYKSHTSLSTGKDTQEMQATKFPRHIVVAAKTLDELVSHNNEAFITCVYLTLLGRLPEVGGFTYYLNRLNQTGDKHAVLYQIYKGVEARKFNANVAGLKAAMKRYKWGRFPIVKEIRALFGTNKKSEQILSLLNKIECQLSALQAQTTTDKISSTNPISMDIALTQAIFRSFDPEKYLACNPDVAAAGTNPYEHFVQHGLLEGRALSCSDHVASTKQESDVFQSHTEIQSQTTQKLNFHEPLENHASINAGLTVFDKSSGDTNKDITLYFMQPADAAFQDDGYTFTRLMHYIWTSRLDLQNVFDISVPSGRFEYCKWFLSSASVEYGLTPDVFPVDLLHKLISARADADGKAKKFLIAQKENDKQPEVLKKSDANSQNISGANLVGYAFGEFGMGEHVRMVARSLHTADTAFCIIDQDVGRHGAGDTSVSHWVTDTPEFDINIFHINADVLPLLYFKFGKTFFSGRHNIGYWAWELSKCPAEFDTAINMVDEIWAISDFVTESFNTRSSVPVITMPLAVTVPALDPELYNKAYYGLPVDKFIYFFTFDAASYLDRKNPVAVVRAFKQAFPDGCESVHLLFKTMNTEVAGPLWDALLKEIDNDPRITIISKRLTRDEVLGLNLACDAFVSLHRAEGFGRCVAEAMAYGKPVIVTNYSGTLDFAKAGTACVVDYQLIPVAEGAYPFWKDQVWADPDIEQAAACMHRLVHDEIYRQEMALAGQRYILQNFNEQVVGEQYAKRINEIREKYLYLVENAADHLLPKPVARKDEIVGHIDTPQLDQCSGIADNLSIEGWVASLYGIKSVEIYIDEEFRGQAHHGILRPDIHTAFPDMADSARSGFCYQLGISQLSKGKHELSIVAQSLSGDAKKWQLDFMHTESTRYQKWQEKNNQVYSKQKFSSGSKRQKLLSILLEMKSHIEIPMLEQTLGSLATQKYSKFELIIRADKSVQQEILDLIQCAGLSKHSRLVPNTVNNWSEVANFCQGQFISILAVGDILRPWSLGSINEAIQKNNHVNLVYGDEDQICEGLHCNPIFKPGWSPIFLESYNYIGRPWFAQKSTLISALSSLDLTNGKLNEHLLLKTIGSMSSTICHIPTILVSRNGSVITDCEADYAINTLSDRQIGMNYPKISIIIPTCLSNLDVIDRCFAGLVGVTDYPHIEVIVVVNNVADNSLVETYLNKWSFRIIYWDKAFSWSGINNFGAAHATGDYLLFMNDDVEPIKNSWLKKMLDILAMPNVGVVGARLEYPNGTIQHFGVNFVDYGGGARHLLRFCRGDEPNLQWLVKYPREVSAVTGACLLTSRECFNSVNGFDEALPLVCNDTDFCLRILEKGYSVVIQPEAVLIHHEGISRAGMSEVEDVKLFWSKWEQLLKRGDKFTNPNLDSTRDDWLVNPDVNLKFEFRTSNLISQDRNRERM